MKFMQPAVCSDSFVSAVNNIEVNEMFEIANSKNMFSVVSFAVRCSLKLVTLMPGVEENSTRKRRAFFFKNKTK
jgi:hypothetical protein